MRPVFSSLLFLLLSSTFSPAQTVKVLDPDARPISGARVTIFEKTSPKVISLQFTDAQGTAVFHLANSDYRAEILAPGFAPRTETINGPEEKTVKLALAVKNVTVNVTATRSELPADESGVPAAVLDAKVLELIQPISILDAVRYLPGAFVNSAGRRGSLGSLFVRGGESRYNKVLVDEVPVNDAGGTFDLGVVPTYELDRLEFVRGAESTLYGSDAMTSVLQIFTANGNTRTPEFSFGAEGGTFATARGFASLAGARGRFDYNIFGDQLNTEGQGPNDDYFNSSQGGNLGAVISSKVAARLRVRHSNSRSGVQSFWNFNGNPVLPPDQDQFARQNNFLASFDLAVTAPSRWQHRFIGTEYHHTRLNEDNLPDRGCAFPAFLDCGFTDSFDFNRAGFAYRGEYNPRSWFRGNFGYSFEDENGFVNQNFSGFTINSHGLRRNQSVYGQGIITRGRLSATGGLRYEHNESFGNKAIPHAAVTYLAWKGRSVFTGTRLRLAYGEGIKEPRLEESFGSVGAFGPVTLPNPNLKAEENRSVEVGFTQNLGSTVSFSGTYYNNQFTNQIAFSFDPVNFTSQYVNLNKALAHGAEFELRARPAKRITLDAAYVYTSTQILEAPQATDPLLLAGRPLLRRPKHSANMILSYIAKRWSGNLGGTFVGPRPDSDFNTAPTPVTHAAGYARFDLGAWYAITKRITAYGNIENLLNHKYEEVAGYPALKANFRAGLRFRIGGE